MIVPEKMNEPGKFVLLRKVQPASKQIKKVKKQKNKQLKSKLQQVESKNAVQSNPKQKGQAKRKNLSPNPPPDSGTSSKKKKKNKQMAGKKNFPEDVQHSRGPAKNKKQTTTAESSQQVKMNFQDDLSDRLKASRFRFINEQLYTQTADKAIEVFSQDDSAFDTYHAGYRKQVEQWPLNPLDRIIKSIKKLPTNFVVADFGCGEARLAESITQKCYSFDLVAKNNKVIACNMADTPLSPDSVNVAVFCLSLMGTNLKDFLLEANRVLKIGGHLKIAEIESRFDNVNEFINNLKMLGFDLTSKDISTKVFYFLYFKKSKNVTDAKPLKHFQLKPCMYKKR